MSVTNSCVFSCPLLLPPVHPTAPHIFQRLQELHLQENSVEVLGEQALAGLGSLALLDLSRNNLHTLSQASLRPLVSLQVLRVTGEAGASGGHILKEIHRHKVCDGAYRTIFYKYIYCAILANQNRKCYSASNHCTSNKCACDRYFEVLCIVHRSYIMLTQSYYPF